MPKISVIVPVYNTEKYLHQCINSILEQTFTDFELILVDDGATDLSGEFCDYFAQCDERVKVIHKMNGGLSSARNIGIDFVSGDRVIFIDSDDYWASPFLLEYVSDNCNCDNPVIWKYQKCREDEEITVTDSEYNVTSFSLVSDYAYLIGDGILFASACYLAVPYFWFCDNKLRFKTGETSEDVEWFAQILQKTDSITLIDAPLYVYRTRPGSISNTVSHKKLSDSLKHVIRISEEYFKTSQVLDSYISEQTANYIIVLSRSHATQNEISDSKCVLNYLNSAVRKRSKIIKLSVNTIGLRATLKLIQLFDRIKLI